MDCHRTDTSPKHKISKNWVILHYFTYYMCTACKCYFKALIHRPRPFSELTDIVLLIKHLKIIHSRRTYSSFLCNGIYFLQAYKEIFYTCTHYRNTHCFFENVSKCAFSQRYYCRNYNRCIFRICRRKTYRRVLQKKILTDEKISI